MRRLAIIAAAVAILGLAAVVVGGSATSAQEGDGPIGTFLGKVADKLGIGEDELKEAFKDARLEMIDEAVAEGRLTEEQAERLKERVEEGGILFPPRPPGEERPHPGPGLCRRAAGFVVEAASQVLDMPKDDLVDELKDGKSLAAVAEDRDMGADEFTEALLEQARAQLDELVADGKLTEEQAERLFTRFEEHIDSIVNAVPEGDRPCRPRQGPRDFRGPWRDSSAEKPFDLEPSEVTA